MLVYLPCVSNEKMIWSLDSISPQSVVGHDFVDGRFLVFVEGLELCVDLLLGVLNQPLDAGVANPSSTGQGASVTPRDRPALLTHAAGTQAGIMNEVRPSVR